MSFNDYFRNPILINLDRRTDRLGQFDNQAKNLDITYKRFQAVEATDPPWSIKEPVIATCRSVKSTIPTCISDTIVV